MIQAGFNGEPGLAADIREILFTPEQIRERVSQLGALISRDYAGLNPLLVGVLKGVVFFIADLLRAISIPVEVDFIAISSYSQEARDQGFVRLVKDLDAQPRRTARALRRGRDRYRSDAQLPAANLAGAPSCQPGSVHPFR